MNAHDTNTLSRTLLSIARAGAKVHAVADAIGCPDWTSPDGCNRKGECFCATAAKRVTEDRT